MGSAIGEECFQCPCCITCKECKNFKELIHIKETGLVIYQHNNFGNSNKEAGLMESSWNPTADVFILHNTRDVEITSGDFMAALEKNNIKCPRCKIIIKRTKILLQKNPTIDKKGIIGVCDHCLQRERSHSPCNECENTVKKFITEYERRKEGEQVKIWVSKIKHLLKDARSDNEKTTKVKNSGRLNIYLEKSSQAHKTEKTSLLDTNRYDTNCDSTHFILKTSDSDLYKLAKSKEYFHKKTFVPVAEVLLRPNKIPLVSVEDTALILHKTEDLKIVIEDNANVGKLDRKVLSFEELEKHLESKSNGEFTDSKHQKVFLFSKDSTIKSYLSHKDKPDKTILEETLFKIKEQTQNNTSMQDFEGLSSRDTFKNISEFYRQQKFSESGKGPTSAYLGYDKKVTANPKKNSQSLLKTKKYNSEQALITFGSDTTEETLDKNFSYCFPKEKIINNKSERAISSTELILDTQNMLIAREEEQKKKVEEEHLQRLHVQELKRIAREEKNILIEEKKRFEDEKRIAANEKRKEEDTERKVEEDHRRNEKEQRKAEEEKFKAQNKIKQTKNIKAKEDKSKVVTSISKYKDISHDDSGKNKLEPKQKNDKESSRADKEADIAKRDKEEQLRLQKEEKQKEKEEKERLKRDKEADRQKKKEAKQKEKDKLKREKDEDLRKEKELKESKKEQQNKIESIDQQKKKDDKKSRKEPFEQQKEKSHSKEDVTKEQSKGKSDPATDKLKTALLYLAKEKEEAVKNKKDQEDNERKAREAAAKIEKEAEELKLTSKKEAKSTVNPETEKGKPIPKTKTETPLIKELNINQIKVRRPSQDDLILQLVQLKQTELKTERHKNAHLSELNISPLCIKEHQAHKNAKLSTCLMCIDSDLELDVESIVLKKDQPDKLADIVIGQKIFKYKPPLIEKKQETLVVPILFQSVLNEEISLVRETEIVDFFHEESEKKPIIVLPTKYGKANEQEVTKGVIRYALSDRTFIEKGWTMLPTEKVVRKMNVYRMRPAHPEFDWFEHNKNKRLMLYDTGEKLAEFNDNGLGQWFYRNGRIALDYYDAEEVNAQQRLVIYSSGEPDERGRTHPLTILATFDYLGNGIVFDHGGKIRLKYNQTEGVVLDRSIGPVSHWKWHTLNDPPVLQKVMIDTQMAHKDLEILKMVGHGDDNTRSDNEEMLAIEFDNFIKEKSKKLTQAFKPFQIKMKALRINEHFSLKILDQATVYLIFRDGTTNLKLNIGMILDHKEIVDTDTAEVGEVSNNLQRFPARTNSLAGLQRSVAYAQRFERLRTNRERRLHASEPCSGADRLIAAASRPLHPPFRTVSSGSTSNTRNCKCSRKPSSTNLYYNTRLI